MEATPDVYRADIAHSAPSQHHIALIDAGELLGDTEEQARERRARLVRQVANLERALARAEALWAQAQVEGEGPMTRYIVEYTTRDLRTPRLERTALLMGRSRTGAQEVVTFASLEQAQNAASVQRSQKGVLRATVLPVKTAR